MQLRKFTVVLIMSLLAASMSLPVQAASCEPSPVFGSICFDTLPRLVCCSAAYDGWSLVTVGDRFLVSGRAGTDVTEGLRVVSPSGGSVSLTLDASGAFREVIAFDEEGLYRIYRGDAEISSFSVAYRAVPLDVDSQEWRAGNRLISVSSGQKAEVKVLFTDAKGRPVINQTLAHMAPDGPIRTDEQGIATITWTPGEWFGGYDYVSLYPGLVGASYREVRLRDGVLEGLPGGSVRGTVVGEQVYLPLRDLLVSARPDRFRSDSVQWDEATATVRFGSIALLPETGHLFANGSYAGRTEVMVLNGRTHVTLEGFVRIFRLFGMASVTDDGAVRLSIPEGP